MKLFFKGKDGGQESTVWGYWLIEAKKLFSVVLLNFRGKSREAYHTHAFNSVSWLLNGWLFEQTHAPLGGYLHTPSWRPIITKRSTFHKVDASDNAWVLSFRGPWVDAWQEWLPNESRYRTLTHGRQEV